MLFGLVPLPSFVMRPHCVMDCHADGKGYDLTVEVWLPGLLLSAVDRASGSALIQPALPGLVMRPQDGQLALPIVHAEARQVLPHLFFDLCDLSHPSGYSGGVGSDSWSVTYLVQGRTAS
jgi:hypothetical protein